MPCLSALTLYANLTVISTGLDEKTSATTKDDACIFNHHMHAMKAKTKKGGKVCALPPAKRWNALILFHLASHFVATVAKFKI